ncbi:hypothetical protein M899_3171 [Bacteriovorax sp. BSW11_IV]|uniref:hypothetical protein n=1 Tax=Bacteriovorax sp. BSW11_IV TaxID=1353529 RepID=UPI00038A13FF|nr:hypothetical protein [Bacteriovorax sp. BSW11_IV]EQC48903.1 hypothetical protein M899_3171 [Bacteriovorax sp. BSW11_IV]
MEKAELLEQVLKVRPKAIVKFLNGDGTHLSNMIALVDDLKSFVETNDIKDICQIVTELNGEIIDINPKDIIKDLITNYKNSINDLRILKQHTITYKRRMNYRNHDEIGLSTLPYFSAIIDFNFKSSPNPLNLRELVLVQHFLHALDSGVLAALSNYLEE